MNPMNATDAAIAIAIMAVITAGIRILPFAIFAKNKQTPAIITYLGTVLPYAIIGMLIVYCLKNLSFTSVNGFAADFIAIAVTVLTYVWKRNTLLSIVIGTLLYMLLVQLVF